MKRLLVLALVSPIIGCSGTVQPADSATEIVASVPRPPRLGPGPAWLNKQRHPAPQIVAALSSRRAASTPPQLTIAPKLTYGGGPLIDDVEIYAVYWGSKIDPTTTGALPHFFSAISGDAPYMQMLSEYDINNFVLGRGSFKAAVTDAHAPQGVLDPTTNTFTIQDADVQAELSRLVDEGALPQPNGKNIFMVYFDAQTLLPGACVAYCAYHSSFQRNTVPTYYGILPDLGHNGCQDGCGFDTVLNNLQSTSSHELVEAMTDADVGDNNFAWTDPNSGNEIGDICTDWDGIANGFNVQSQWSNESNGCRVQRPSAFGIGSITTTDATVAPGGTAVFNIITGGDATGPWTLDVRDFVIQTGNAQNPPEYKFAFTPSTVAPGESAELRLTVPENDTLFNFGTLGYQLHPHIAATDANGVHRFVEVNLNVVTGPAKITKLAPLVGPTLGGTAVVASGDNFAADAQGFFCPATGSCDPASNAVAVINGKSSPDGKTFKFTTPDSAAGRARFMVLNPADSSNPAFAASHFKFVIAPKSEPTITSITPSSGPTTGGTNIVIVGSNFDQDSTGATPNLTLTIGGVAVTPNNFFFIGANTIFATTPAHSAGHVAVTVTNADKQSATKAHGFSYGSANAPASGLALNPANGSNDGGSFVIISGNNFLPGVTVTFGGKLAAVKSVNSSFIDVVSPAHTAGKVPVIVTNPSAPASPPLHFTFVDGHVVLNNAQ
jgi:hypothetical protein